jgi:hypothetical protein
MGWWSDLWTTKAKTWCYGKFEKEKTPDDIAIKQLNANEEYLHVYLKSMRIVNVRKGLSQFYGAVHSFITIAHRSGTPAQFNVITTANKLQELDGKNVNNIFNFNKPLLGPIPYRGGNLEMELGLFSIKAQDLAKPYLSLLTELSSLAGVSFISAALPFVNPIKNGINMLAGGQDDTILEIGLSTSYPVVETGYYAVIRATKKEINFEDLKIGNDFRLLYKDGRDVEEYPYLIFQIFSKDKRDDWFNIPEIAQSYKKLQEDVSKNNYTSVKDSSAAFKRALYLSNDLILDDAKKIFSVVDGDITSLFPPTTTSKGIDTGIKKLKDLELYEIF